jgi:hypothetical protein
LCAGAFICIYVGNLFESEEANKQGQNYGDEYFADLDMIETVERQKVRERHSQSREKQSGFWIRIRIGSEFRDFVDPDPYWESGSRSRGKKTKKFQWKNALFSYFLKNVTTEKVLNSTNYFLKKM